MSSIILQVCLFSTLLLHAQVPETGQDAGANLQDTLRTSLADVDEIPQDTILVGLKENIEFFGEDEPLKMNLVFDIRDLLKEKDDQEYMDAVLHLYHSKDTITWNIRIKARGEFRRNFCSFPPIMINVKGVEDLPPELREKKTMKLVTHCRDRREYRDYVFMEYLIYKMYALLSPYSFNVRLVNINYIDEADPDDVISSYGFLIENLEHLAERNHVMVVDEYSFQQRDMVPEIMAKIAVFQYMISNVDWQVGYHNIKALAPIDAPDGPAIPVPYDFDQTGFVNPEYGVIRTNLNLKSIRDKRYLGDCTLNGLLMQTLGEFAELRDSFTALIEDFEWLDNRSKRDLLSFLNEFFEPLLSDREGFADQLEGQCILSFPRE